MSNKRPPLLPVFGTAAAVLAAVSAAAVFMVAESRHDAAMVVPIAWVWGVIAVVAGTRMGKTQLGWIILAAALVRIPLIGTPPLLSDDLYRYLFEGLALNAGHNPFVTPPVELPGFHDDLRTLVNNPDVTTIYPPLALWWFRLLALGGGAVFHAQLATAVVDLFVVAALALGTRSAWPAWVYALHPLPVLEAAQGAHLETLAVAFTAWGVVAWRQGRRDGGWWGLVAGAGVKVLPAVFLVSLLPRLRHRVGWLLLATILGMAALAWPVLDAGPALLYGFREYAERWAFNGFVYPWIGAWSGARLLLVLVGAMIGLIAWRRYSDPGALWAVVGGAFVLLSPTVHPWYVLWALVPSLLCERRTWAVAAIPLLGSYTVLAAYNPTTGLWDEAPWLWWLTWLPAATILAIGARIEWQPLRSPPQTEVETEETPDSLYR